MTVARVHKTKDYTVMSNNHFREKGMSLKAKGLLSLMLSLPDDWDYSISGLVTLSKDGKDSVMSALSELEKFGYLKRTRVTNGKGQFAGVEYDIYEEPQPQTPVAEKPNEDNSHEEKPTQLNTKLTNSSSKEEDTNKQNTKEELLSVIASNVPFESLRDYYISYIEMREDIGSPLSPSGLEMLIQRCHRLSNHNLSKQRVMLEAATINGWKNVYSPNDTEAPPSVRENTAYKKLYEFYENGG